MTGRISDIRPSVSRFNWIGMLRRADSFGRTGCPGSSFAVGQRRRQAPAHAVDLRAHSRSVSRQPALFHGVCSMPVLSQFLSMNLIDSSDLRTTCASAFHRRAGPRLAGRVASRCIAMIACVQSLQLQDGAQCHRLRDIAWPPRCPRPGNEGAAMPKRTMHTRHSIDSSGEDCRAIGALWPPAATNSQAQVSIPGEKNS